MSQTVVAVKSIYLAGDFRSNWQEMVKRALSSVSDFQIFNPKDWNEEIKKSVPAFEKAYTSKDIQAIEQSEIMIAYVEEDNLALGLALEVGCTVAKGKKSFC